MPDRVEKIMGRGHGGYIVVHVGTNNADKEGTTAILEKYRNLLKMTKQARVDRSSYQEYYQCLETGYNDTEIRSGWQSTGWSGFARKRIWDSWDRFLGKEDMYVGDGLHLSGKGAAVFAEGLSGAVASGLGKVRYLTRSIY